MVDAERTGADDESDAGGSEGAASSEAENVGAVRTRPCPYCGASMRHRHCKYVCPAHGVVMDCSDTFFHR